MSLTRFREIQTEHWPDRLRLDFPLRPIGKLRWLGLVPILFGLGFISVPGTWIWSSVKHSFNGREHGLELLFLLFPLAFVVAGLVPVGLGLLVLCGRTRIVATRDRIKVTEIAPFVRRSRKILVRDIERLEWGDAGRGSSSGLPPFIARLGGLAARTRQGTAKMLLIGYPGDWMEEVGKELSSFLQFASAGVPIERVEAPLPDPGPELPDLEIQPAGSKIKVAQSAAGTRMDVPALGFAAKTMGLIFFSIFWLLIVGVLTFVIANPAREREFWFPLLFLSIFWAVGFGMLYFGLRIALRRARILADGSQLTVTQWGVVKSKNLTWRRNEITALKAGESGMKINGKAVLELQVFSPEGKKGFLGGRDEQELRWIATALRKVLNVPAEVASNGSLAESASKSRC